MKYAQAFSPGHITGLFSIHDEGSEPLRRGSLGAGFCVNRGVMTTVRLSPQPGFRVSINQSGDHPAPVSRSVLDKFFQTTGLPRPTGLDVSHQIDLPLGSGFGTSGAGALSLALAVNALFDSPLSRTEAAQLAHRAEIANRTGLGTVIGEFVGGFEIRTVAGAPGYGQTQALDFPPDLLAAFVIFGPYSTAGRLADSVTRARVNQAGGRLQQALLAQPSVERFQACSAEFTDATGLASPAVQALRHRLGQVGLVSAMLMFGDGLFSLVSPAGWDLFKQTITDYIGKGQLFCCGIDPEGGRLASTD